MIKNLQTLISWKMVFHIGASSFYLSLFASYSSCVNVILVERMVTTWYLMVHIGFVFMALGLDLIHLFMEKSSKIVRYFTAINNIIFISIVFPFGLFVPMTYWSLFFYNCNLILPNIVEITVPNWVSTTSHSVISLVVLLEMVSNKYTYKGNYVVALTTMGVFSMSYITCLVQTYAQFGFWIYPILHLVPEEELWMVFLALATKLVALFFFGAGISFLIHGNDSNSRASRKSNSSAKLPKADSVAPPVHSGSNKISDSIISVVHASSPSSESKSLPQKTTQLQLRDFANTDDEKIHVTSKNDSEVWYNAVNSPEITSFVEDCSRNLRTWKQIFKQRIGNDKNQIEQDRKTHENHKRTSDIIKPPIRYDQRKIQAPVSLPTQGTSNPSVARTFSLTDQVNNKIGEIFRLSSIQNHPQKVPEPVSQTAQRTSDSSAPQTFSLIDQMNGKIDEIFRLASKQNHQLRVQTPVSQTAQRTSNPAAQSIFSLTDQANDKLDGIFRSENLDVSLIDIPAPIADDGVAMDSLDITLISPPPPSLALEPSLFSENKHKKKKSSSSRKEKSKSATILTSDGSGIEPKSSTNALPSGFKSEDVSKTNPDKESITQSSKLDTDIVPGKKDKKKKKEIKESKPIRKVSSENSSFSKTSSSDRWAYLEIASKREIGRLEKECLHFEPRSLPVNVDDEVDGKKRDYRRNIANGGVSSSLMLSSDEL